MTRLVRPDRHLSIRDAVQPQRQFTFTNKQWREAKRRHAAGLRPLDARGFEFLVADDRYLPKKNVQDFVAAKEHEPDYYDPFPDAQR